MPALPRFSIPFVLLAALAVLAASAPLSTRSLLANSAMLAGGTTAIALPLGLLLAVLIGRFDLPGRRAAAVLLGLLLFLPLYVQLSGWDAAIGKNGWFTLAFGEIDKPLLAGLRGAIFVHAMAAVPWVALLVGVGLWQVDPAQEEAALLVAPPSVVLARITLPQVVPFVLAAGVWCIVGTTAEMTVTNIYLQDAAQRTYTEAFYSVFSLTAEPSEATLAALPGAMSLMLILLLTLWMVAQYGSRKSLVPSFRQMYFPARGPWLAAVLWMTVLALVAVPVASLIDKAGFVVMHQDGERVRSWSAVLSLRQVTLAPFAFGEEFGWTLVAAIPAATVALALGVWLAWSARRGGWRSWPAAAAVVLGLAIPGPLVGLGLIWLLNHDVPPEIIASNGKWKSWLLVLYDETPVAPILAQAIRALPVTVLLAWHSFSSLSDDVLSAAALDGLGPRQVLWRIALPQRKAALVAAWLAAFAVAAGDLAWSLLVLPPGMDTIQRRVFGLVHSGVEEQVAAISLVTIVAYTVVATVIVRLLVPSRATRWAR
jgi:iron(III) transport system permease protein